MLQNRIPAALLALAVATSLVAQDPHRLHLRCGSFDPRHEVPAVPANLRSASQQRLWLVQFAGMPSQLDRNAIQELGGQLIKYMPSNAYVVRMERTTMRAVSSLAAVRWVGSYHPAYRVDPALLDAATFAGNQVVRYNVVVADKHHDKPALVEKTVGLGGAVVDDHFGSVLITVDLTGPQLQQFLALDEVLWVDRWSAPELDMDNARIQGGANYVGTQAGYSGQGVNAHIYEGIEESHPDFTGGATAVRSANTAQAHGHATAGIVFGNGTSNPAVRGMAPDVGKFYTNYTSVSTSRWQVFHDLVNLHDVSHTTASWGDARTFFYTSVSMEADDITFDHDITWTQSQSNAGNQDSRPQAWAKNVFSVGGVAHGDNSNAADDSWQNGGASIGPAADGRIKPTMTAYYDNIGTSDLTGSAGYAPGDWSPGFGGTSGATPIVAGHNVLAIQMFTDEVATGYGQFGNQLRVPGGSSHQNRPSAPTLKALMCVNGAQYPFTAASSDNRREHQGWGFPNLQNLWDNRTKTFLVDETDVMTQGQVSTWPIAVAAGEPVLKVCLNWREPGANPAAAFHLINNLSLRVTSPSGTQYWGNHGLDAGVWSVAGGGEDARNSLECVFVQNPEPGSWTVDVIASAIHEDNHVETAAVDADYGLAVIGGTGPQVVFATFNPFGSGCPGSVVQPFACPELNPGGGSLSNDTNQYEYSFQVVNSGSLQVTGFDLYTNSTGGTINRPAHIYASSGSGPATTPLASTTITVGATPGFYTATFGSPVTVNGTFYIGYENSPDGVISNLNAGAGGTGYYRTAVVGNWNASALVQRPSWRVSCIGQGAPLAPRLSNLGLPKLGQNYSVTLADTVANTLAVLVTGTSTTSWSGGALPAALPGAPGCDLIVAPEVLQTVVVSAAGTGSSQLSIPNAASLVGFELFHQYAALDAVNALGIVVSNGGRAALGN